MYGATIQTSETIINHFGSHNMLSISNIGSSRNCKSVAMPPVPNKSSVACNPMQPFGMLKV